MREPSNDEQRLMIIGGFDSLEEYLEWLHTPPTDEEEFQAEAPDWEEIALRELGCFESGSDDDNDPDVLAEMLAQAEWWEEENERRKLLKDNRASPEESEPAKVRDLKV